jgi:hypothetical protein
MTPKEKAKELTLKFIHLVHSEDEGSKCNMKSCALLCVDEIIYSYPTDPYKTLQPTGIKPLVYWREVKQEISLL